MKSLWLVGGFIALGLAAIGVLLPLLPTVPFLLVAAFCFARSSKRLHSWLLNHPTFGAQITSWERNGAIARPAKWLASLSMLGSVVVALLLGLGFVIVAVQSATLLAVSLFIWTRPEA